MGGVGEYMGIWLQGYGIEMCRDTPTGMWYGNSRRYGCRDGVCEYVGIQLWAQGHPA